MTDREKVAERLEKCERCECDDCTENGASHIPWDCPAYDNFIENAIILLKEQPDIIRCENCKFAEKQVYHRPKEDEYKCILSEFEGLYDYHNKNWYCADGKRRETND